MQATEAKIVALGSNQATTVDGRRLSSRETLEQALAVLSDAGVEVVKRSQWWRSAAWPDASDPPFLNGIALVQTALSPEATLAVLHAVEARFGRDRSAAAAPNAPRPLDLDLIAWGRRVQPGPPRLPHPRAHERRFVMGPLAELLPDWAHPTLGANPAALAVLAPVGADAAPVG